MNVLKKLIYGSAIVTSVFAPYFGLPLLASLSGNELANKSLPKFSKYLIKYDVYNNNKNSLKSIIAEKNKELEDNTIYLNSKQYNAYFKDEKNPKVLVKTKEGSKTAAVVKKLGGRDFVLETILYVNKKTRTPVNFETIQKVIENSNIKSKNKSKILSNDNLKRIINDYKTEKIIVSPKGLDTHYVVNPKLNISNYERRYQFQEDKLLLLNPYTNYSKNWNGFTLTKTNDSLFRPVREKDSKIVKKNKEILTKILNGNDKILIQDEEGIRITDNSEINEDCKVMLLPNQLKSYFKEISK